MTKQNVFPQNDVENEKICLIKKTNFSFIKRRW